MSCPRKQRLPVLARVALLATALVLLGGCASAPRQDSPDDARPPESYLRLAYPDADTIALQVAVRQFKPMRGSGPVLWLAGASHVGESNYFHALQQHLDAQALVLYEGVGSAADQERLRAKSPARPPLASPVKPGVNDTEAQGMASLQSTMARSLGLVFQLSVMNYARTNFRNSDLSIERMQALLSPDPGLRSGVAEAPERQEFQELIETMQGRSALGMILNGVMEIVGSSPRLQALARLALIEALGNLKGDLVHLQSLPPEMQRLMEVVIQERNKVVLADLKRELKQAQPPRSIAVLYGAAHLADLESRARQELGYRPVGQEWLTVCIVQPERAGLTGFEMGLVRTLVRSTLESLRSPPR